MEMTCNVRVVRGLPLGADCSIQDYSLATIESHGLTTGTANTEVVQHCAGSGSPPDVTPERTK